MTAATCRRVLDDQPGGEALAWSNLCGAAGHVCRASQDRRTGGDGLEARAAPIMSHCSTTSSIAHAGSNGRPLPSCPSWAPCLRPDPSLPRLRGVAGGSLLGGSDDVREERPTRRSAGSPLRSSLWSSARGHARAQWIVQRLTAWRTSARGGTRSHPCPARPWGPHGRSRERRRGARPAPGPRVVNRYRSADTDRRGRPN